jgi:AcrR family transcriptional regulator
MSSSERGGSGSGTRSVAPLYARLPHGPHRLGHEEVIHHQRSRIHGAMVEAVAANGYAGTSVRQVVELAGVSRRSFYEQFANKEECFLATYDLIAARGVERVRNAYSASEGTLEERMRTGFRALAEGVVSNWKGARLAIVEAQTVGPAGLARLRATTAALERMLAASFAGEPHTRPPSTAIVRAILGGSHWVLSRCLREGDESELPHLAEEMLRFTLLLGSGESERMPAGAVEASADGAAGERDPELEGAAARDDRARLMHEALRLALLDDHREVSAPRIAAEADVSLDAFFELFSGKEECFLAAQDSFADELLELADDRDIARSESWPRAVRRVMAALTGYLAEHPLYAQTIAAGAFVAGPEAIERNRVLVRRLSALLIAGAPEPASIGIAGDAIAGAIGHTIRCQVASGQIERLTDLSDQLSYVVLAPFLGAETAAEILSEERLLPFGAAALEEVREQHADEQ